MNDAGYRHKVLIGEISAVLRSPLYERAEEIIPDHAHLFIQSDPTEAPQRLAKQFKGYCSWMLGLKDPELRSRLPSMRSSSYSVSAIDHISETRKL